jgi:flagellar FliL protein
MSDQATTADQVDGASGEEGAEGGAPKSSKKKLIILIVGPLLLLLMVAGGLFFTGIIGGGARHEAQEEKKEAPKQTVFFDLPDLLVNINSGAKKASFLKMSISLEIDSAMDVPKVQAVMPRIIDNFQVYLRELRIEDLKGSSGLYRLREELLLRVNAAAAPAKINDVLFKEMLVQ